MIDKETQIEDLVHQEALSLRDKLKTHGYRLHRFETEYTPLDGNN